MRHRSPLPVLILICLGMLTLVGTGQAADSQQTQSFSGNYQWSQGGDGFLAADFRPKGDGEWKIQFRFRWSGKSYTWNGTATGSLEDGSKVSGTAKGGGGRTWEFSGSIKDGVMTADHAEKRDGSLQQTGTFKISR